MEHFRVFSGMKHAVGRKVFSKVSHPAAHAEPDHVIFDNGLIPLPSIRVRKVDHCCREGGDRNEVVLAVFIFYAVALLRCVLVQVFLDRHERIDISQKMDAFFLPCADLFIQRDIKLSIPLPVPHDLIAKAGSSAATPVLRPDAADLCPCFLLRFDLPVDLFAAFLNRKDRSVIDPVRKTALSSKQ